MRMSLFSEPSEMSPNSNLVSASISPRVRANSAAIVKSFKEAVEIRSYSSWPTSLAAKEIISQPSANW